MDRRMDKPKAIFSLNISGIKSNSVARNFIDFNAFVFIRKFTLLLVANLLHLFD